jgi:hypothetical protein
MKSVPHIRPQADLVSEERKHTVAMQAFFRIMEAWQVPDQEAAILLGSPSRTTFYAWKKGECAKLRRDTLERVSYVLGIYKALQILFPTPERADAWIRASNAQFGGKSALDHALAGNVNDLYQVRTYLDYVRGGHS